MCFAFNPRRAKIKRGSYIVCSYTNGIVLAKEGKWEKAWVETSQNLDLLEFASLMQKKVSVKESSDF